MHPALSYELATARIADLCRQAQRDALARATTRVSSCVPRPGRSRVLVSLRRIVRQRRFSQQLWTLLHAQVLLDGPAAAAGSASLTEDSYRRFADRRDFR